MAYEKVGGAIDGVMLSERQNDLENDLENNLTQREEQIIFEIKRNPRITQKELSEKIKITDKNIRIHISKLNQKGLLERIGPDKGGYWRINEEKK